MNHFHKIWCFHKTEYKSDVHSIPQSHISVFVLPIYLLSQMIRIQNYKFKFRPHKSVCVCVCVCVWVCFVCVLIVNVGASSGRTWYLLWLHWENCPDVFWHGQQMRVGGCGATVEVLGYTASTPQWSSTATQHCEHPWKACITLVSKEVVLEWPVLSFDAISGIDCHVKLIFAISPNPSLG